VHRENERRCKEEELRLVKKALAEIGYDGFVTAEMLPFVSGRPEKTAKAMKQIFKN
jgi:hypothetical protein